MIKMMLLSVLLSWAPCVCAETAVSEDKYLWLEDIASPKALDWVRALNARTLGELERLPYYKGFHDTALAIVNDKARIPYASLRGSWFYNFWQDERHVRGIWRRARFDEYPKKEPKWETVLDLDALAAQEKENWVFKRSDCLAPGYTRCLLSLSRGGKDAAVVREFDISSRAFVSGGFYIPESKSSVAWLDRDTLLVADATDLSQNTDSGYPRLIRKLRRGAALGSAEVVLEASRKDLSARPYVQRRPEGSYAFLSRAVDFYETEDFLLNQDGSRSKLHFPRDAAFSGVFKGYALASLRSDWNLPGLTAARGSLVAVKLADITGAVGPSAAQVKVLYEPDGRSSLDGVFLSANRVLLNTLSNIRSRVLVLEESSGAWKTAEVRELSGGVGGVVYADEFSDYYTAEYNDFLTPHRLYLCEASSSAAPRLIKERPARFDASAFVLEQSSVASRDGVSVPYFIVRRKDMRWDGSTPALLYGYGGFEISMLPEYSASAGRLWLEQGGAYVLANIRGGGELGPQWHKAALKENRQRAFDDFLAVAQDLVARKITSPSKLGIMGGSNGGLLMGAALTQRPDLFGAVVCQVPLLDMLRYHKLLAGASWMAEYGDPDSPSDRRFIEAYSPYQRIRPGVKYPPVFFVTSSKDDRVHPGHARKAAAKLLEYGDRVFFFENVDGGHGANANNNELARRLALEYSFLRMQLNQ